MKIATQMRSSSQVALAVWTLGILALVLLHLDLTTVTVLAIGASLVMVYLLLPESARLRVAVCTAFLPVDGAIGHVPFVSRAGQYAWPMLVIGVQLLALKRGSHLLLRGHPRTLQIAAVSSLLAAAPALVVGFPSSGKFVIVLVAIALAVANVVALQARFGTYAVLGCISVAIGLVCVVSMLTQHPWTMLGNVDPTVYRARAGLDNPNRFSGFLGDYELLGQACAAALACSVAVASESVGRVRLLHLILAAATAICLLATGSILAIVSAAGLVVVAALVSSRQSFASKTGFILSAALVASASAGTIINARLQARGFGSAQQLFSANSLADALDRRKVWEQFMPNGVDDLFQMRPLGLPFPYEQIGTYPHNTFIFMALVSGSIGLVATAIAWTAGIAVAVRAFAQRQFLVAALLLFLLGALIMVEPTRLYTSLSLLAAVCAIAARSGAPNV